MSEITAERALELAQAWVLSADRNQPYVRDTIRALRELVELQSELHAGHYLVAQSPHTTKSPRPGWMICGRCEYETPSVGWCPEHNGLDTCWAKEKA